MSKEYTPFFYAEYISYYGETYPYVTNNTRFNHINVNDWYAYFKQKVDKKSLDYLLTKATYGGIDSVYSNIKGEIDVLSVEMPQLKSSKLDRKKTEAFFEYLLLAKSAEAFATVDDNYYWDLKPASAPSDKLETPLMTSFKKAKDSFIKQRLWFQVVRYQYFLEKGDPAISSETSKTLKTFNDFKDAFPKNMMYYRTLGYVAGWHYKNGDYAVSNYLNSLCYNYSWETKIPAEWSFRPQEEADWHKTLSMAKNTAEKVTLWHLLGIHYDPQRAIQEIIKLDPKSEKLDLLLARIVNQTEYSLNGDYHSKVDSTTQSNLKKNTDLIASIASKNNTAKPYFWNLAAGYLNVLNHNNADAKSFYNIAKKQLPKGDKLIMAQYKILDWTLYINELKRIDANSEQQMLTSLNWFSDLKAGKDSVPSLRFNKALSESILKISDLYKQQGDAVKANAFSSYDDFYKENNKIEQMKALLQKENKTAFEQAMLRYYPYTVNDLYYHQALVLTYQDKIDEAILMMDKTGSQGSVMPANPFNISINDCHDCDHAKKQSKDLYILDLLKTMQNMKAEIKQGNNVYNNAYLLANAFYNITFYGNARQFYSAKIMQADVSSPYEIPAAFREMLISNKIAEKYYLMAANNAKTKEQKAKSMFMASKCERNESYNRSYNKPESGENSWNSNIEPIFFGKYFSILKSQYNDTQFYKEALKECGYFRRYDDKY